MTRQGPDSGSRPLHEGRRSVRRLAMGVVAAVSALSIGAVPTDAQTTILWNNPAGGNWGDAVNWDPQNVPNAAGEEAVFPAGGGAFSAVLNGSYTVDRVLIDNPDATLDLWARTLGCHLTDGVRNAGTLTASASYSQLNCFLDNLSGGLFRIPEGGIHYFNYDSLRNEGTIHIGTAGGAANATLYFASGDRLLTGSGECLLESGGTPARASILPFYGGFTQDAAHTIRGSGQIHSGFTNYGAVVADVAGEELWVHANARTNHGTMSATGDGILVVGNNNTIQGPTGLILADGGIVRFVENTSINGGTLNTANGGVIQGTGSNFIADITNEGRLDVSESSITYWQGTQSSNNGTLNINPNASSNDAVLYMYNGTVTIDGTGEIVLRTAGDVNDARLSPYYGGMIQGAGHTIRGEGRVATGIDNYGTIRADADGRTLLLSDQPKTNRGSIEATNNGILQITSGAITQEGGTILADGGKVQLANSASVTGGTFATANGGLVEAYASCYLNDITNLGAMALPEGARVYWHDGESVNDGTITINPEASATDAVLYAYNGPLNISGSGEIVLRTACDVNDAQLSWYYGSMSQGPGHTIRGEGRIITSLVNNGLVSADVPDRVLLCDNGTKTNNALMQATGGGTLRIQCPVNQTPDAVLLGDAGTVLLGESANITGGRLRTAQNGHIEGIGSHFINDITTEGDFRILSGSYAYCSGSTLTNTGTITINPDAAASDAVLHAYSATVRIEGDGDILLNAGDDINDARMNTYYGSFIQGPDHLIHGTGAVHVNLTNEGTVRADVPGRWLSLASDWKLNQGLFEAADSAKLQLNTGSFRNEARVVARDGGEVRIDQMGQNYDWGPRRINGGRWEIYDGSTMRMMNIDPLSLNAEFLLSGQSSVVCRDDAGTPTLANVSQILVDGRFEIAAGRDFLFAGNLSNAGHLAVGAACSLTVPGTYTQTGYKPTGTHHDGTGWTTIYGTFSSPDTVRLEGGTLRGTGTVAADVRSSARVSPGGSAGTLTIEGGYVQNADGHLYVELGDPQTGSHDLLAVTGHAALDGRIWVAALEGFEPAAGDTFTVMTFASSEGAFTETWGCAGVGLDYEVIYEPAAVKIALFSAPSAVGEPEEPARPENPEDPQDPQDPGIAQDPAITEPGIGDPLPEEVRLNSQMIRGQAFVRLDLPQVADVTLEVFDFSGRRVAEIHEGYLSAGSRNFALADGGAGAHHLSSGVYLARATVRSEEQATVRSTRILLVR